MREIDVSTVKETVSRLCEEANLFLPEGMRELIRAAAEKEESPLCKSVLNDICDNADCAEELNIPICQDTGMAVIFMDIGQEIHFVGGDLYAAVNCGVEKGYVEGKLRLSVVGDPLKRVNTDTNTPAIIHTRIIPGDKLHITVAPKGFGSENMSRTKMFTPSASKEDIIKYIVSVADRAGSNPCPPITVGVGIGGDFEYAAYLSKKALCRDFRQRNGDPFYAEMEEETLNAINALGIGAQGFGGTQTCLYVNIEQFPTHIAGLPVAVNIGCHVTRHKDAEI